MPASRRGSVPSAASGSRAGDAPFRLPAAPLDRGRARRTDRESVMRPVQSLGRAIVYLWQGPPSLPRSLQLEWRFVVVRWLGIFIVAPGLLLTNLAPGRLLVAY